MVDATQSYREIIKLEFLKRRTDNPFYSLRRFARDLGLAPNHLSYILRGKRGLSRDKALKTVIAGLRLKSKQAQRFRFMVSAESGRSNRERGLAKQWLNHRKP